MARIFYSMAGEGRGHATRVRALVESMRADHELYLFAPHHAFDMLAECYGTDPDIRLERIPGLLAHYRGRRLNYFKTFLQGVPYYLRQYPQLVSTLVERMERFQPDLAITDFEPTLPRAARRFGIPFVSFDHQHFLTVNDLGSLPFRLRLKCRFMGSFVKWFYRGQQQTIVSSFFNPALRKGVKDVVQTGVMLRPEILSATPQIGDHLLVYLRRFAQPNFLEALRGCGRDVRIYGLGARPEEGRIKYFDIDQNGFIDDLARCYALISNAGNQLVGEAHYLRKPVLALPESGNFEQQVNAHFVRASGGGDWKVYEEIDTDDLKDFLERVPELRAAIDPQAAVGNDTALRAILKHLPATDGAKTDQPAMQVA